MTGLTGGRSTIPPKPRPSASGESPARKPFRSIPAENVPPSPVSTSTRTSALASNCPTAAAMPRATSPLTALRACGRLIVMTAIPSSTSVRTASAITASLRLESEAAVEADDLGVHVVILDQRPDQVSELGRGSRPLGEDHGGGQLRLELLAGGTLAVYRRVDDARADGVDPHADGGQVTRGGDGHADDPALRRRVGDLAGLPLDPGDRRGVDDHAALAIGISRLGPCHRGRPDAHEVEGAGRGDVADLPVAGEVVRRPVAAHRAACPA